MASRGCNRYDRSNASTALNVKFTACVTAAAKDCSRQSWGCLFASGAHDL
jgi:hypothetical protein